MNLDLAPETEAKIDGHVSTGRFPNRAAVVTAALLALDGAFAGDDFAPGELDAMMAAGKASGPPTDGLAALERFHQWRAEARQR